METRQFSRLGTSLGARCFRSPSPSLSLSLGRLHRLARFTRFQYRTPPARTATTHIFLSSPFFRCPTLNLRFDAGSAGAFLPLRGATLRDDDFAAALLASCLALYLTPSALSHLAFALLALLHLAALAASPTATLAASVALTASMAALYASAVAFSSRLFMALGRKRSRLAAVVG